MPSRPANALAGPLAHAFGTGRVIVVAAVVMFLASLAPVLVRSSRDLRRGGAVAGAARRVPEEVVTPVGA